MRKIIAGSLCIALVAAAFWLVRGSGSSAEDVNALAVRAYMYAYPLVSIEMTRRVGTNVASPRAFNAPMNQFAFLRSYPDASFTAVVAPNADTLYESGFFDVSKEPIVIHTPALGTRYALFPMLDAWSNVFASPGTRTTGASAQTFALVGPGWHGTLPAGVREQKSPTSIVWMIGRIYSSGTPEDLAAVHKLQDEMTAVPLSAYGVGRQYTPPQGHVDPAIKKTAVVDQVNTLSGPQFFALFASLLAKNPPAAADAPEVAQLAQLGIVPGKHLNTSALSPAVLAAMNAAPASALKELTANSSKFGTVKNGWTYSTQIGTYGTNYLLRAVIARFGLGANLPQDAVYPRSVAPLDGSKSWVIHFAKGQMPPVSAFWSLTLYNKDQFFYGNSLNRYNVSSRTKFVTNADGSVDVYVGHTSPGAAKEANWLPAPADAFVLMLRLYWPRETPPSIIDGTWAPPQVQAR